MPTIVTQVNLAAVNHVDDGDVPELLVGTEYDSIEEYAESMEGTVEAILAERVFGDADELAILDVTTEQYDDWNSQTLDE